MSDEKDLLILITKQLDNITTTINDLNIRIDRLEGKTDDIHQYIPFVNWLEVVAQNVSQRFKWIRGHTDPPQPAFLNYKKSETTCIIPLEAG